MVPDMRLAQHRNEFSRSDVKTGISISRKHSSGNHSSRQTVYTVGNSEIHAFIYLMG